MFERARVICILAVLMSLAMVSLAEAQVITATIRGKVVDQQGGVLPGATVTARQVNTNALKTAVTTALGTYLLPSLPAGVYDVEVTLSGFAPLKRSVELAVGADVTFEFTLKVGA